MKRLGLAFTLLLAACGPHSSEPEEEEDHAATPSAEPSTEASVEAPAAPGRISRYSRLNRNCRQLELQEDEGGWSLQRCKGEGDYTLLVTEGDLRQNILLETPRTLGKEKARSLDLAEGTSGGFSRVGDTAEWRGPSARDFKPDALIVRFGVVENSERPDRETSWLLVYALRDGDPCLVAKVPPAAGQNDKARTIVDGPLECVKPD